MPLGKKRKDVDIFDEPEYNETERRIPSEEQKRNNQRNVMLSMLKGTRLTYSLQVDSSYDLMLCGLPDKETLAPLLDFNNQVSSTLNERLISTVIQNVKELMGNEDVPLDYVEPDEIESSYSAISKDTNRVEVNIL